MPLAGCVREVIVEKPVPVEVVVEKPIPVPADFLIQRNKSTFQGSLTYGEALQLWSADRANLDILNAQIRAIQGLSSNE